MERGTKLYKMDSELRFIEYEYLKKKEENVHLLKTEAGVFVELNDFNLSRLLLSKIMVLAEIEEKLRFKIEYIHQLMREYKFNFNPLDTADIIYVLKDVNTHRSLSREIHQYSKEGLFLYTFPSVSAASKYLGKPDGMSVIRRAVKNGWSAYGYKWSFIKSSRIKLKK